jgi:hypothetical protein
VVGGNPANFSLMSKTVSTLSFKSLLGAFALAATALSGHAIAAEANTKCPMMIDEDVEAEKVVDFKGNKILMCCGKCEKAWDAASDAGKAYWVKAAIEEGVLPQLKGKEKELGLEEIKIQEQLFSAVSYKTIVTPESPTVEYNGKKYFVFNDKEQKKWDKDPEGSYKKAVEAGVIK